MWTTKYTDTINYNEVDEEKFLQEKSRSINDRNDEAINYEQLSNDTYSLLLTNNVMSFPFLFATSIFCFQMLVIVLIVPPIISFGTINPMNVPPNVIVSVRLAQILSIIISVMTQGDVFKLPQTDLEHVFGAIPGLNYLKFVFSLILRFIEGFVVLMTTFCLVIAESTVIDIFMNFSAMVFVAELDDIAILLAQIGLIGENLKKAADELQGIVIVKQRKKKINILLLISRTLSLALFVGSLVGLGIISSQQSSGFFLCENIKVQFDDEIDNHLGFMSGIYRQNPTKLNGKVSYEEKRSQGRGRFAYCDLESAWTFSFDSIYGPDPCNWVAKSPKTEKFDITEIPLSEWKALNALNQPLPFVSFSILCIDCAKQPSQTVCSGQGACIDNICRCVPERFGISCEFSQPCSNVEIDVRQEPFFSYSSEYEILEKLESYEDSSEWLQLYEKPVYAYETNGVCDILFFVGRRWVATKSTKLNDFTYVQNKNATMKEQLVDYLNNEFHGLFSNYIIDYISAPTDANTPNDAATPVDLNWYKARFDRSPDYSRITRVTLLCATCKITSPGTFFNVNNVYDASCFGKGHCINGGCECKSGAYGVLCQADICRSLSIAFDDTINPELAGFSGVYNLSPVMINKYPVYIDAQSHSAIFAYCSREYEKFWSFTVLNDPHKRTTTFSNITYLEEKICLEWKIKSIEKGSYDIMTVATSKWSMLDPKKNQAVQIENIQLFCNDCDKITISNEEYGICHGSGTCSKEGNCDCETNRYGVSCEFMVPLPQITVDKSLGGFPSYSSDKFDLLQGDDGEMVKVYNFPVYAQYESDHLLDVILFTGRRWVLTKSNRLGMIESMNTTSNMKTHHANISAEAELRFYLNSSFHGSWSNFDFDFISDPVDTTQKDINPTPQNMEWYETPVKSKIDWFESKQRLDIHLTPSTCNDVNSCQNGGLCVEENCICEPGFSGAYCEKSACKFLNVEFSNQVSSILEYFSGTYKIENKTISDRSIYKDTRLGNSWLAYCDKGKFWSFTFQELKTDNKYEINPCNGWKARTSTTFQFDVTALSEWMVINEETTNSELDTDLRIICTSCIQGPAQADRIGCNENGSCMKDECSCNEGWFGLNCEFEEPCETLEIDPRYTPFPLGYSKKYFLLKGNNGALITCYGKPIYYNKVDNERLELIFFIGRRWVLTNDKLMSRLDIKLGKDLIEYLSTFFQSFHAYWETFEYELTTDMTVDPIYASPVWMKWFESFESEKNIKTKLLCSTCNSFRNPCRNNGVCRDGNCDCTGTGFAGQLCQVQLKHCKTVAVEGLQGFSGLYQIKYSTVSGEDRPLYISMRGDGAQFQFCPDKKQWSFNGFDLGNDDSNNTISPCDTSFYAESDAYDISTILNSDWKWNIENDLNESVQKFTIECTSCGQNFGIADDSVCSKKGQCVNDVCICDESSYGIECQFDKPCSYLESASLDSFPNGWPNKWTILRDDNKNSSIVMVYDHPVYISETYARTDLIMFTGHQWVLSRAEWLLDINKIQKIELIDFLSYEFHAYLSDYKSEFSADGGNGIEPIGLEWRNKDYILKASLLCAVCDMNDNTCLNGGHCDTATQKCICSEAYSGSMCQSFHASCFMQPGLGIPYCKCDASCASCGFTKYPVMKDNCITCADMSLPISKKHDGTGICNVAATCEHGDWSKGRDSNGNLICEREPIKGGGKYIGSKLKCFEGRSSGYTLGTIYYNRKGLEIGSCSCHKSCSTCFQSSKDPYQFDASTTCMTCADGYSVKVVRELNGIEMGVCANICRQGSSEYC